MRYDKKISKLGKIVEGRNCAGRIGMPCICPGWNDSIRIFGVKGKLLLDGNRFFQIHYFS